MKRRLQITAVVLITLAMVVVRVVWSSRSEYLLAQAATGDQRVFQLGRAARLYAPGNPYSRRALEELVQIGRARGADSLAAWQEARSAILATRSFYTWRPEILDEANGHIAERMALKDQTKGTQQAKTEWHAERLRHDPAPSVFWSLIAILGLAAWITSAALFIVRGLDEKERLRKRAALFCAAGLVAGFILFFVGLARA